MDNKHDDAEREQRLQEALVAYLEAVEADRAPEAEELLARYPEFADELAEFLANRDQIDQLAAPLRQAVEVAQRTIVNDAPTLAPGTTLPPQVGTSIRYFGEYELLEEIARGGMGVVFRARQTTLKRIVALKMILSGQLAGEEEVKRFYAEAEAAAKLDHPNIVPIFEIGQHDGQHYFSMSFIEGESLAHKVADGPVAPREAAELVKKIAVAIAYAHTEGVIHRDLKPGNVLVDRDGEPRITDFGLAKRVEGDSDLTSTGQVVGTPSYMPPEQASGKLDEVGPLADVYAAGGVLYCLLTARPPFQAANPLDTLLQVLEKDPVPVRDLVPQVPRDLETICLKCLEKEPRRRYGSAGEFAEDLQRFLDGEPVKARPISRPARLWRWCRRKPVVAGLTAAVTLLLLTLSIAGPLVALQQAQNASEQARLRWQANEERGKAVAAQAEAEDERQKAVAAQQQETKQRTLAEENEIRAGVARERSLDAVTTSLYQQAIAVRNSLQTGRRWSVLALLKKAEEIRARRREYERIDADTSEQDSVVEANLPTRSDLRSEAVAALLMKDARVVWERRWDTHVATPSVSHRGHRAAVAWMKMSDPNARGVRLVDLADGRDIQIRNNSQMWATAVGLSPDGKTLASPTSPVRFQKKGMALWNVDRGTLERTLDWPEAASFSRPTPVFNPNGRFLAAASRSALVVWNLETGTARTVAVSDPGPRVQIAFSADGNYLAYRSGKRISLWNLESEENPFELELPLRSAMHYAFAPNEQTLAVYGIPMDNTAGRVILLWDPMTNAERGRISLMQGAAGAGALAFSPDGSLLAGSDEKGSIYFFDLATRNETFRLQLAHQGAVTFLWWDADSRHLLSSSPGGSLKYWELSGESTSSTMIVKDSARHFAIGANGNQLAVMGGHREPGVRLINRETGQVERTWNGGDAAKPKPSRSRPELLLFRHDGQQLAQIGRRLAVVWDVSTGDEISRWEPDPAVADELSSAAFAAHGQLLASGKTGKYGKMAVVWNVATGERVWRAPQDYLQAHLSADGTRIAATPSGLSGQLHAPEAKRIAVWELASGRELNDLQRLHQEGSSTFVFPLFSPDGHWLAALSGLTVPTDWEIAMGSRAHAIGGADSHVALWNVPSGERRPDMRGPDAPTAYAFSPDSAMLAIGYRDGSAKLWDVANHEMVFRWKQHSAAITQLAFTPDGTEIAARSGMNSPSIRFLDLTGLRQQLADVGLDW